MKSKFTNEEKQEILNRYISKSESSTSIIKSVDISKSTFYAWLSDYRKEQEESKRKGLIGLWEFKSEVLILAFRKIHIFLFLSPIKN